MNPLTPTSSAYIWRSALIQPFYPPPGRLRLCCPTPNRRLLHPSSHVTRYFLPNPLVLHHGLLHRILLKLMLYLCLPKNKPFAAAPPPKDECPISPVIVFFQSKSRQMVVILYMSLTALYTSEMCRTCSFILLKRPLNEAALGIHALAEVVLVTLSVVLFNYSLIFTVHNT